MQPYTVKDRIEIVKIYYQNSSSLTKTQNQLKEIWKDGNRLPQLTTIRNIILNFENYGSVCDRKRTGRHRQARSSEMIALVLKSVQEDPTASIRTRSQKLGITRATLQRILVDELKFKVQMVHLIAEDDGSPKKISAKDDES